MVYRTPRLPLTCNVWRGGGGPPSLPDVISPCQLTPGHRSSTPSYLRMSGVTLAGSMYLLLPAGTDIRDNKAATGADLVEVPAGSGRYYAVHTVDDVGCGFRNEYRFAQIEGIGPWDVPFPVHAVASPVSILGVMSTGSQGAYTGYLVWNLVLPAAGFLCISVAVYGQPVHPAMIWGGMAATLSMVSPDAIAASTVGYVVQYIVAAAAGPGILELEFPEGHAGAVQIQVCLVTGIAGVLDVNVSSWGLSTTPTLVPSVPSIAVAESFFSSFVLVNMSSSAAFSAPFESPLPRVTDTLEGVPVTLTGGSFSSAYLGTYTAALPSMVVPGWAGLEVSYY